MNASLSRPVHGTRPSHCGREGSSPGHCARSAASGPGTASLGAENALVSAPGKTASRGTRPLPVSGRVVVHRGAASMKVIPGSGWAVPVVDVALRTAGSALSVVHAPRSVVASAPTARAARAARAAVAARRCGARVTTVAPSGRGIEDVRGRRRDAVQAEATEDRLGVGRGVDADVLLAAVEAEASPVEQRGPVEPAAAPLGQRRATPEAGEPARVVLTTGRAEDQALAGLLDDDDVHRVGPGDPLGIERLGHPGVVVAPHRLGHRAHPGEVLEAVGGTHDDALGQREVLRREWGGLAEDQRLVVLADEARAEVARLVVVVGLPLDLLAALGEEVTHPEDETVGVVTETVRALDHGEVAGRVEVVVLAHGAVELERALGRPERDGGARLVVEDPEQLLGRGRRRRRGIALERTGVHRHQPSMV